MKSTDPNSYSKCVTEVESHVIYSLLPSSSISRILIWLISIVMLAAFEPPSPSVTSPLLGNGSGERLFHLTITKSSIIEHSFSLIRNYVEPCRR